MEMEKISYYNYNAAQVGFYIELKGSWKEDKLFIRLELEECDEYCAVRGAPIVQVIGPLIAQRDFWVKFSHLKQQLCDNNDSNLAEYKKLISKHLKRLGVPEHVHPAIFHKIFNVVEAAVSPEDPVRVLVWDITRHTGPNSIIAASRSFIQGLEVVTVPETHTSSSSSSCVICLEDFEQETIARLTCKHHFHVHCIVPWLEINHMCPLCRYPMRRRTRLSLAIDWVSRFVRGILEFVFYISNNLLEDVREHRYLAMILWCLIAFRLLSF